MIPTSSKCRTNGTIPQAASVVAILAKSTKPRGEQALDVPQALQGHKMAEHDEAPATGKSAAEAGIG